MTKDRAPEKRSDPEEQGRQLESDEAGSAPVTMPNPFAKGLDNPKPPYPLMSRRLNEEGKVVLNVCVSLSGLVEKLKLEKTSGYQRLDDIALETVKKWKFIPAKNQDRDINACYLLPVQFILRKDRAKLNG
jgi:protein TonB